MRITIMTYGSRGDVQPYVALGVGLRRAGYAVRVAAPEAFAGFVRGYGLDFAPLAGNPAELARVLVDEAGLNPFSTMLAVYRYAVPLGLEVQRQARAACADADAVIFSFLLTVAAHEIALEQGIPAIFAQMYPMFTPTGAFPAVMFPDLPEGTVGRAAYNRLTHRLYTALFWQSNRLTYSLLLRTGAGQVAGMPPLHGWPFDAPTPPPVLFGWSPQIIARPAEWGDQIAVTGFWYLDAPEDWQPPADLLAFLDDGPPPVYVGFGSVVTAERERLTALVLAALARAGQRGVLLGGWSGLGQGDLPDTVYRLEAAPHDWLFPRMRALVHHGGAGTTAAGLRAGVPAVIVPFSADQGYWGRLVQRAGVGLNPIPRRALTVDRLAYAIHTAATHGPLQKRAAALGKRIRAEDGVGQAVAIIEQTLTGS